MKSGRVLPPPAPETMVEKYLESDLSFIIGQILKNFALF